MDAAKPPTAAPPDTPAPAEPTSAAPAPKKAPANLPKAPVAPSPEPPPSAPSATSAPAAESPTATPSAAFEPLSNRNPVIVTEQAPPVPSATENEASPFANLRSEESNARGESTAEERSTPPASSTANDDVAVPTIEPPRPADSGSRYQEYLDRYFDRKKTQSASNSSEEENTPTQPKSEPTPPSDGDEPPTLSPSKPAKEYNDPFRPTSYRSSPQRTWRDPSGEHRLKARFLGVDDRGMALMLRDDGIRSRIPLANLSNEDQHFIELLAIRDVTTPPQAIATRPKGR